MLDEGTRYNRHHLLILEASDSVGFNFIFIEREEPYFTDFQNTAFWLVPKRMDRNICAFMLFVRVIYGVQETQIIIETAPTFLCLWASLLSLFSFTYVNHCVYAHDPRVRDGGLPFGFVLPTPYPVSVGCLSRSSKGTDGGQWDSSKNAH